MPRKDREGDACHFIGACDGNKLEGLGLHQLLRPGTQCVFVQLMMIEDRMGPHDEQPAQIAIAHFRDTAQPLLAASIALIVSIIM